MYHPFTIAETLKKAWNVIKKNFIVLIIFTLVTFFCNLAISKIDGLFNYENNYAALFFKLIIMLLEAYVTLAFYRLLVTLIDREYYEFSVKDIIPSFKMAINAVFIGIILIIVIGTVNFLNSFIKSDIVAELAYWTELFAAIYLSIRLIFCLCFIVDDDSGAIEALKQSFVITRNNFFKLLTLLFLIIFIVAILLFIINLLITFFVKEDSDGLNYLIEFAAICWFAISFPTVQVMIITTYRKLVYSQKDIDDDINETD